jgi:glutathione S-transferase
MGPIFWQLVRTPAEKRDAAAIEASRVKTEKLAALLDAHFSRHRFLTDYGFTPADIVVGCAAHRWLNLPANREPRAHLERWYGELKSRPGSRQVTGLALS